MPKLPPPPDPLSTFLLWIGAVIEAIKAGGITLPHGAPLWLASDLWGFVPFVLISAAALIMIFRRNQTVTEPAQAAEVPARAAELEKHPALLEKQDRPPSAETAEPVAHPSTDSRRVFVPDKVKPEYLFNLREGKTELQLNRTMAPYLGKWIVVSGVVQDVSVSGKVGTMHVAPKGLSKIDALGKLTTAFFKKDLDKLEMYEMYDEVLLYGRINTVDSLGLRIVDCELVA